MGCRDEGQRNKGRQLSGRVSGKDSRCFDLRSLLETEESPGGVMDGLSCNEASFRLICTQQFACYIFHTHTT